MMNRDEAKEYVKKILKTNDGEKIKLVLKRYFQKFRREHQEQDIVELAKKIFNE